MGGFPARRKFDSLAPGETRGSIVLYQLPHWVWPAAVVIACLLAVWRGRDEERLATGAIVLGWAMTVMAWKVNSQETQWAVLAVDLAEMPVFLWIALRSVRWWPLFATAFKLLIVVTHLAHAFDPSLSGWAYLTAGLLWSYLALFTVAYASWSAPRAAEVDPDVASPMFARSR